MPDALLRELNPDERPRQRLHAHGSRALSDAELISLMLNSGRPGVSALGLARRLLQQHGGLTEMATARAGSLRCPGVGAAKEAVILAAFEIGRRLARGRLPTRLPMDNPHEVARYLTMRYCLADQEIMGALYLDTRQRLIAERELFRGSLHRTVAEPRLILKQGLLLDATCVLLFHTHPSGDPSPSPEDLRFTRRFAAAGDLVGIELIDHLVLGNGGRFVSLRERVAW